MYDTLRDFLEALDAAGELHRVTAEVSPILEITEIADRESKSTCAQVSAVARTFDPAHCESGGRALLFENVQGCDFPLAINAFGSYRRMEMALGCEDAGGPGTGGFEAIAARLAALTTPKPPGSVREMLGAARRVLPLLRIPPRRKKRGICQEIVRLTEAGEVDLTRIPLIKCWPLDGDPIAVGYNLTPEQAGTAGGDGRYITFAGMHTIHADDAGVARPASHNIGMYRAQLLDATRLCMHWHLHHDGAAHWRSWKRLGQPMPIAICFGGESVLPYAATAPLPPGMSELLIAGFLHGRGIPMVPAMTVPLRVPANSEIVIEGFVSTECGYVDYDPRPRDGAPGEPLGPGAIFEGPFGDHTGYYSMPDRYPILQVTAVTHRRDAIFPATIVGHPPQEDYYMGKATERVFLPLLRTLIPDIDDYHLPMFGCFHNCAFIRIRKEYALQARRVMHAVWGAGQMAWTKCIVVVDDDVDVHDERAVLRALFQNCHFGRDVETVHGPLDILDHSAPHLGAGGKIGFDATRRLSGESAHGISAETPVEHPKRADEIADRLRAAINAGSVADLAVPAVGGGRCVFVSVAKENAGDGAAAIHAVWRAAETIDEPCVAGFVIAVDQPIDPADVDQILFHWCANCDVLRDVHRPGDDWAGGAGRIAFDATAKRPGDARAGRGVRDYPPILEMDEATRALVDRRWREYGFDDAEA